MCGNVGCLETVVSNSAIENKMSELLEDGYQSKWLSLEAHDIEAICKASNKQDAVATELIEHVGTQIGRVLAMSVNMFNPEKIVISGEITQAKNVLFAAIRRTLESHALPAFVQNTPLVASELSNEDVIGAFALVKRALFDGSLLRRLIEATQFSMANQDARYFLNGMKFETEGNLLRTVATDGHRLAVCTIELDQDLQTHSVILPRKGVLELNRLLESSDELARLQIGTNNLRIHLNHIVFTSKLIDGRFPDYRRVLPRNATRIVEGNWETLKQAFVRASILSNERVRSVRLNLSENQLKITASNPEHEVAEEIVDVNYQGEEMEVGFNVTYILDVLNALKCQQVRIRLTDASSSCLIENSEDASAEYVIMPMRL